MKRLRKTGFIVMTAAFVCLLSACGSGGKTEKAAGSEGGAKTEDTAVPGSSEAGTTAAGQSSGAGEFLITEEPLTLTAHIHNANIEVLSDDWVIEQKAGEMTNVYLKGVASVNETDSTNAFNLMIASKDLPDIAGGESINLIKYGMEGAFIPLEDLIEQYAPNIQKMLNENPDVRATITAADGHIYYLPTLEDSLVSQTWFIRQDWLDTLGLSVPQTVEELHDVLLAFASQDPNGNGKKDEIGYFNRNGFNSDLYGGTGPLYSMYGVNITFHINRENQVALGAYTSEFKEAMKQISKWYAEGLIDPEIFTRGGNARDILFAENNGGFTHDWYPSTSSYNTKMQETVPGFKLVGILPPKDINGDQWEVESRQKVTNKGTAISSSNQHVEETIKYLDFWWTEEGSRLMTYGIEGDTFVMEDGEPVYTDKVMNNELPINSYMKNIGGQQYYISHLNLSSYENFMMSQEGVDVLKLYQDNGVVNKICPNLPSMSLTEEETELIQSKWPIISTYILEQIQKWTFDGSAIDSDFDKYMSDIKAMGIDEILSAYQNAYDRIK